MAIADNDIKQELSGFLIHNGLARAGEDSRWIPLLGGVSSDIWKVELPGRSICVKRALARLKVAADWQAPVSRNLYEWHWLCFAHDVQPEAVPRPLAHDEQAGVLAMELLDPDSNPVWKAPLMQGDIQRPPAESVGRLLVRFHAASAFDPAISARFDTSDNFLALRIEPYVLRTAERHPDVEPQLRGLAQRTLDARIALVHGDVSPKNILLGRNGPVFLDAECAWFGDPAFDLAFCLNHLLLKCLVLPGRRADYLACYSGLATAYLAGVDWEPRAEVEGRAARLLPALLLARVDGKSPVEYLNDENHKRMVREVAKGLLVEPAASLEQVSQRWNDALAAG